MVSIEKDGKCGCLDTSLSEVVPIDFYYADCSSDFSFPVLTNNGWAYFTPDNKTLSVQGYFDYLEPYLRETALAYTYDSVYVLNRDFKKLFSDKRGNLSRADKSNYFIQKNSENKKILINEFGKRIHNFIGNGFEVYGNFMILHGENHFPYYRADTLENYIHGNNISGY